MKYQESFLIIYLIVFAICTLRAYRVLSKASSGEDGYVHEVHSVLAVIMTYHMMVASVFVHMDPTIAQHRWFSICNTTASVLCAVGFYLTNPDNRLLRYSWNFIYLFFASVLMGELWIYFGLGQEMLYSASLISIVFVLDTLFYNKKRRKHLIQTYVGVVITSIVTAFYLQGRSAATGFALNGAYVLAVVVWLYLDHDQLADDTSPYHLDDALKYFYDFEGTVIRYINSRSKKKIEDFF